MSIVDQPSAVLDSKGNKIVKGEIYYLEPVLHLPCVYKAAIIPGLFREECWLQLQAEVFTYGITGLPRIGVASRRIIGDEFLSLHGVEEGRSSWFKIEKALELSDRVYKLVSSSEDVGTSTRYDGTQRLVLTHGNPLSFQFVAVSNIPSATK
ncbi:hypothetical protein TIFTF001_010221 [Ficus carica]|uniref:Uncharacterized protein n=1 Tax=Ficus carica TaxID=3494 RepID=A0AA88D1W7_FICCA|nr:hypothetical protein TIFTF001_010221 [Ficus carica]